MGNRVEPGFGRLPELGDRHKCRHSASTVSKILNHVESGITAVYDRHSYDAEKRHALDLWGSYVERVAAGKPAPSNVVELARAGR